MGFACSIDMRMSDGNSLRAEIVLVEHTNQGTYLFNIFVISEESAQMTNEPLVVPHESVGPD